MYVESLLSTFASSGCQRIGCCRESVSIRAQRSALGQYSRDAVFAEENQIRHRGSGELRELEWRQSTTWFWIFLYDDTFLKCYVDPWTDDLVWLGTFLQMVEVSISQSWRVLSRTIVCFGQKFQIKSQSAPQNENFFTFVITIFSKGTYIDIE